MVSGAGARGHAFAGLTHKNDQAWVEQKNGAIVRRLMGYGRFEGPASAAALARLYAAARLHANLFQPSFKLREKVRVGARVTKRWHPPATPADRALASGRGSTQGQYLAAQREALVALGVAEERIHTDHGRTGTTRARPGLDQALAAVRAGDTLVVPKLDRLARSVPDARHLADELERRGAARRGVKLALGASVHDPTDPMGRMFFNILATFAEFEADLIRMRTREGMAVARARGKLRGKKPKLSDRRQAELRRMHGTGDDAISDLAELFAVSRPTVYRVLQRVPGKAAV